LARNVRFVKNETGIRQVLTSPAMAELVRGHTVRAAEIAEGLSVSGKARYRTSVSQQHDRIVGLVGTTDIVSRQSNAKHHSLEKARHGC
jgi:hypothetical protein